jgi:hypothetical protein
VTIGLRTSVLIASLLVGPASLDAQPAQSGGPMRVALLVDTSDGTKAALIQLRAALLGFLDTLPPGHELLLVSTGRHTQVRVRPTTDYEQLRKSVKALLSDGGPTPLMDSLVEVDERFMRKAEPRFPVFVIVTGDGSESSVRSDEEGFNKWIRALAARPIVADAVVIKSGNGFPETIARVVAQATSGHLDIVSSTGGLKEKLTALAEQLGRDHPPK